MTKEYLRHRSGVAELTQRLMRYKYPGIDRDELLTWFVAGFLHDIGKEVIDKRYPGLLEKAAPLTNEECKVMRTHTEIGWKMLRKSHNKKLSNAVFSALEHHERWNGSGYSGKQEYEISLPGRVVAVADVYDALSHDRPYRKAWRKDTALNYMKENSGILFDPEWVDVLILVERNRR